MSEPDTATIGGRLQRLALLSGLSLLELAPHALLGRTTLVFAAGSNEITSKTARKLGAICGGTPERQRAIAGWLCFGAGEPPQEDEVRQALAAAGVRA